MLTAPGNRYLASHDITGFWPDAPTFKFMALCEFRTLPASGKDADDYPLRATDPMSWFTSLKPWCKGLRLHYTESVRGPHQQSDTRDRMLVGFVGGGPRWLIEAAGQDRSELWQGFHRFGERGDAKPWLCTNILQAEIDPADSEPVELHVALSDLRTVLPEIEAYARDEGYANFADCFASASQALASKTVEDTPWLPDIRRYPGFSDAQLRVLQAVNHAWVFGGMGSWNDLGAGGERYDSLSERLFAALNDSIAGLANSTYNG